MSRDKFMRSIFLIVCFLFFCGSFCLAQQTNEVENQVDFETVLDKVLPIEQRLGLNIGFRTHRDLYTETLEYSFLFSLDFPTSKVSIVTREADTVSVYDQLATLRRQNPKATIEHLTQQIKVKEQTLTEVECPQLKQLFFSFEKINFRSPSSDLIVLHPMIYEIKSRFGGGDMYLTFVEEEQPLVKWALRVKAAANSCAAKAKKPIKK